MGGGGGGEGEGGVDVRNTGQGLLNRTVSQPQPVLGDNVKFNQR